MVAVQGYHGDYAFTASRPGGANGKSTVELKPGGTTVKIILTP